MWLTDIGEFARTLNVPKLGANIFVHTMPHDRTPAAMLVSGYQGMPIDQELPGYYRGPMQMIVRAKTSADAEEIATALMNGLWVHTTQMGSIYVNHLRPEHLPAVFPRSNGDFYEASVNFEVCFVAVSA